jgi:hypothetical protein
VTHELAQLKEVIVKVNQWMAKWPEVTPSQKVPYKTLRNNVLEYKSLPIQSDSFENNQKRLFEMAKDLVDRLGKTVLHPINLPRPRQPPARPDRRSRLYAKSRRPNDSRFNKLAKSSNKSTASRSLAKNTMVSSTSSKRLVKCTSGAACISRTIDVRV